MITVLAFASLLFQDKAEIIALKGGRVLTMSAAGELEGATILIADGKIKAIGKNVDVPMEATLIELPKTAVVVPGFIDAHSHLASVFEIEEATESVTPHVKAIEAFASQHRDVRNAVSSGVTLVAVAPGNGNLVGGRVALVRMNGRRLDRMIVSDSAAVKLSLGDEALRRDREPTSRTGALRLLRDLLRDPGDVKRSLVERRELALIHASGAGDIARALEVKESANLNAVLVHALDAKELASRIKDANVPVAFGPLTVADPRERLETPAALAKAGVKLAFVTDAPATAESQLRETAALAVKHGLDRQDALRALTIGAAEILGVGSRFGSLDAGKEADVVVYSGDPLSLASAIELVVVEGRIVHRKPKK
jgi:imidazolonepropionase-like amidohydrolase